MADYWAYNLVTNVWSKWTGITSVSYVASGSIEDSYDGLTHSFEPPMKALGSGENGYVYQADGTTKVSPDSISKTTPRSTARKRSYILLTKTSGQTFKVWRDEIMNGAVQNVDPADWTTATMWAFNAVVGIWAAFNASAVAYTTEDVYDGRVKRFEFNMKAISQGGNGYVTKAPSGNVSPDSISQTVPAVYTVTKSVIKLTCSDGVDHPLFRDQLMNGTVQNTNPSA